MSISTVVAGVRDHEVRQSVAVKVGGLDVHREQTSGVEFVGRREGTAAGPLKDVNVAVRRNLAHVRRYAGDRGGDIQDAVAIEVGDGQGRRYELDFWCKGGNWA